MELETGRKVPVDKHSFEIIVLNHLLGKSIKYKLFCIKGLRWLGNCMREQERAYILSFKLIFTCTHYFRGKNT